MNYVKVAVPFFVLLLLVEFLYGLLRKKQTYRLNDTVNSLQMGVISQFKNILRLGFSGVVFGALVNALGIEQRSIDNPVLWIATFIAYDICYYFKHRFGHEWRIMWAAHAAHHQSEEYNLSTALRQTGTDYIGFVFYFPMYLAGIPVEVIITVGSLNLIYQFWVHTEHIGHLGPMEWIFVTPSNHRVHHARNPGYIDKNYGGVFILWDRIFGTFCAEDKGERCVYGVTKALRSWNPLWANFHVWYDTFLISLRTRRWQDKFIVWFKGPGWLPEDMKSESVSEWRYPKFDPLVSRFVKVSTFMQLWVLTLLSLWLPEVQAELPRVLVLLVFFWAIFSFYVQGVWLEGRAYAESMEWLRLSSLLVILTACSSLWPQVPQGYLLTGIGYFVFSSIIVLSWRVMDKADPAGSSRPAGHAG
jgi:sterol desaturase/sphingolipid hydroxylase (fatty acid hydroxylase superfamily)